MKIEVMLYGCPVLTKFEPNLIKIKKKIRYIGKIFEDDVISPIYKSLSLYKDKKTGDIYSTIL